MLFTPAALRVDSFFGANREEAKYERIAAEQEHLVFISCSSDNLNPENLLLTESRRALCCRVLPMLWTVFAILIILWLLGWGFHVAGSLIHILLVLAIIVAVMNLVGGRRAV